MNTAQNFKMMVAGLAILISCPITAYAQNFSGAWKLVTQNGKPVAEECIKIYSESYFMVGVHSTEGAFVKAGGGTYSATGKAYTEVLDFNTVDSAQVRKPNTYSFSIKDDELTLEVNMDGEVLKEIWKKVDGTTTALNGAWRFGARVNDEGVAGQRRGGDSPRQTIKILSGKYFQWAAFNYETKQFSGTGGGTYAIENNQYTETIRFFSRDNSRAGMSLTFELKLDGTDWYHKGKGTTGNPVSEVWEKMK